jgi:hypothetical protein
MNGKNGKGDRPRPAQVPRTQIDKNWERTFGKGTAQGSQSSKGRAQKAKTKAEPLVSPRHD